MKVAVGGGTRVSVGGKGVEVTGRAVGASGVRVGRSRKAAAREVGVAVAAGAHALNKNARQIKKIIPEGNFFLLIMFPILNAFPLMGLHEKIY